jgi:putative restriction endonuclease
MSDREPVMSPSTPLVEAAIFDRDAMAPLPPLVEGQHLDRPTFHARYEAMPPGTRAELINGVVHMPSPVGPRHGRAHLVAGGWINYYLEHTPGVDGLDNASTALGTKSEPQPDAMLRILWEYGGRARDDAGLIEGVPELLAEVSHASRYIDLGPKLEDYERVGVQEYVVRALEPDALYWFVLRNGRFVELPRGPDGIYRSEVFPGLWLHPNALIRGDRRRLRAVVELGCATPGHAAFVARLAAARDRAQGQGQA